MSTDLSIYDADLGNEALDSADREMSFQSVLRPGALDSGSSYQYRVVPPTPDNMRAGNRTVFHAYYKHVYKDPEDPTGETFIAYACPNKMAGKPCADCTKGAKLRKAPKDTPERKAGMDISANHYRMVCVVDRNNEAAGPQVLELSAPNGKPSGRSQFEKLMAAVKNERTGGDYLNPSSAYDIIMTKSGSGRDTNYSFALDRDASPLHQDPDKVSEWILGQPDIKEMIRQEVVNGIATAGQIAAGTYGQTPSTPDHAPQGTAEDDVYGNMGAPDDDVPF